MKCFAAVCIMMFAAKFSFAQDGPVRKVTNSNRVATSTTSPQPNLTTTRPKRDSIGFEHRDYTKDSINIAYRYLDSVRSFPLDSTINDFDRFYSVPSTMQMLGNHGAAAYSLVYQPLNKAGWDAGFHAFDAYRYTLDGTKFYKTSKPFSRIGYQLASGKEQVIDILHVQNPRPNLGFGFDYRLINAPGYFTSQNSNHNAYRLFTNYQGKRKRYAGSMILVGNLIRNSENGGIANDSDLTDPDKANRIYVDVNLGNNSKGLYNPFKTKVTTGNVYRDLSFSFRNSYDIGQRDSIAVNDSTTEYLFYPKLRLQHTFTYSKYSYNFVDYSGDSVLYKTWYDTTLKDKQDTLIVLERWKMISNDFSLIQFPETKNPAQFFLVGVRLENISAELSSGNRNYYNAVLHAEYRNKTRNKLWDFLADGEFYTAGLNNGDYRAHASLGRYLNKKLGNVQLFFNNVNRTPSFIFNDLSSFNFKNNNNYKKENSISFGARSDNPLFSLGFKNHIISNLTYFKNYYQTAQYSRLINLVQVFASKKVKLSKRLNWYIDAIAQQTDGSAPVKVPLLFTRNRIVFEGNFYRNLNLAAGLDIRYYTPFEAYNYSPVMGQFVPQDSVKLKNLPDIAAFVHFRIRSFTGFLRAENLNTVTFDNGFGFTNNNFAAPHYPTPGMLIRFGVRWGFVN